MLGSFTVLEALRSPASGSFSSLTGAAEPCDPTRRGCRPTRSSCLHVQGVGKVALVRTLGFFKFAMMQVIVWPLGC